MDRSQSDADTNTATDVAGDRTQTTASTLDAPKERLSRLFIGPNTLGQGRQFWLGFIIVVAALLVYPLITNAYVVLTQTNFFIWIILALSLSLIWGYGGIFTFAQTAVFGVGGYVYGILSLNLLGLTGATNIALLGSIVIPMAMMAILGYFIFYGGVSGLFVAIITLVVPLILNLMLSQTSDMSIGAAELGGLNGFSDIPTLQLGIPPFTLVMDPMVQYYFVVFSLIGIYIGLRWLLNSRYGYMIIAVRENENRTRMFGYNTQKIKVLVFALGAGIAGFAGALYASWGNFIEPSIMGLVAASWPVIWVTIGGRESLLGAILGAFLLQLLSNQFSIIGSQYTVIFFGILLIFVVLFFPNGIVPVVSEQIHKLRHILRQSKEKVIQHDG